MLYYNYYGYSKFLLLIVLFIFYFFMYDKIRIRKNNDDLIEMQKFTKKKS